MNGPKVSAFVALVKFGYMLENPSIPLVLASSEAVTIRGVRTISRKGSNGVFENPQRPHAEHLIKSGEDMVRTAWRHAGVAWKPPLTLRREEHIKRNSLSGEWKRARTG